MKLKLLLLPTLLLPTTIFAQTCTGNLGDNVFTDGDFGSGTANIVPSSSEVNDIAPGYRYNPNTPPVDGDFIITNNTGRWAGLYDSWLAISDNSSDPNGYMMVVNASFDRGLFYEQTVENLCENTIYEFSADIINMIRAGVGGHINPNVSFLIDGEEVFTTGDIPQNERWQNYAFSFTTTAAQRSVVLALRNNEDGGIGNDLALDNISFRACGPITQVLPAGLDSICADGTPVTLETNIIGDQFDEPTFQWQQSFDEGMTWRNITNEVNETFTSSDLEEGLYYFRYLLADGPENINLPLCRINSDTKVIFAAPTADIITDSICEGLSYSFSGEEFTRTGTYQDTSQNILGCDSITTLQLTVVPDRGIIPILEVDQRFCIEDPLASVTIGTINNGNFPYTTTLAGSALDTSNTFSDLLPGDYELQITDRFGCEFKDLITIDPTASLSLDLGPNIEVILGEAVTLTPEANFDIASLQWNPVTLCDSTCETLTWVPIEDSMIVSLTAFSELGCPASDSVQIKVEKIRLFQFPSAFTPNGDQRNDFFTGKGNTSNILSIQNLTIYDRWGTVIFSKNNISPNEIAQGWDGRKNDQELPQGIYPYRASVLFLDQEIITYEGAVFLVR